MRNIKVLGRFLSTLCLCITCNFAVAKTDAGERNKMEYFHLQNAQHKLSKQQFNHAWGDLAYLLCQIPNHHAALKHMLHIAPLVDKNAELSKFFVKALKLHPNDEVVLALYAEFVASGGQAGHGQQLIAQALTIRHKINQQGVEPAISAPKK